jgi:GNAT superfamily N-acetyltransferase
MGSGFESIEREMGPEVYRLVYPDWRSAQASAVEAVCRAPDTDVWVATVDKRPVGFVAVRLGREDAARVGEIDMLVVDPGHQRAGVGGALLDWAVAELRQAGVDLAVMATGGDPGHAPARALYERSGFNGFRLVRYYLKL